MVKPFLLEILLARLTAIARRGQSTAPPILQVGDLSPWILVVAVLRNGRSIHVTRNQFDLLELLMQLAGLVTCCFDNYYLSKLQSSATAHTRAASNEADGEDEMHSQNSGRIHMRRAHVSSRSLSDAPNK